MGHEVPESDRGAGAPLGAKASDAFKKILAGGLSAGSTTEEGIRGMLGELRLPREAAAFLLSQGEKTKRDIGRLLTGELKEFLEGLDVAKEVRRTLVGLRVEVNGTLRITEDEETSSDQSDRGPGSNPPSDRPEPPVSG